MDIFIGGKYESKSNGLFTVKNIKSSKHVDIEFDLTGYKAVVRFDSIRKGSVKDKLFKSVHNVGYIGVGDYITSVNGLNNGAYITWQHMLGRCYGNSQKTVYPTYIGCTVCNEWHNFQVFAEWYCKNLPDDIGKCHLDKDIKIEGNKIYSPSTCMFVSATDNTVKAKAKTYTMTSPAGESVTFYNMAKFCRDNGLDKSNLQKVYSGRNKSHKGWKMSND